MGEQQHLAKASKAAESGKQKDLHIKKPSHKLQRFDWVSASFPPKAHTLCCSLLLLACFVQLLRALQQKELHIEKQRHELDDQVLLLEQKDDHLEKYSREWQLLGWVKHIWVRLRGWRIG